MKDGIDSLQLARVRDGGIAQMYTGRGLRSLGTVFCFLCLLIDRGRQHLD